MLLVGMLALAAHANSGCGYVVSGFAVETRGDAPTDAELLMDATFAPTVSVVDGPNGPEPLGSEVITACDWIGVGFAKVSPPAGGWEPKATYTVEAQPGSDDEGGPIAFTFTTSDVTAVAPENSIIESASASAWSKDTKYPSGCCKPTRQVTITATAGSADPWAYLELGGDFTDPGATAPHFEPLSVGIGPGTHALTAVQWKNDDDTLEPIGFYVLPFGANGVVGIAEYIELDLDGNIAEPTDTGSSVDCCKTTRFDNGPVKGCAAVSNAGSIFAALAALAMARRRSR